MLPLMYTYKRKKCASFSPNLGCLECQSHQCLTYQSNLACLLWEFSHSNPIQQNILGKCSGIVLFVCLSWWLQNQSIERCNSHSEFSVPAFSFQILFKTTLQTCDLLVWYLTLSSE